MKRLTTVFALSVFAFGSGAAADTAEVPRTVPAPVTDADYYELG